MKKESPYEAPEAFALSQSEEALQAEFRAVRICYLIHLSQLSFFFAFLFGYLVPVSIWFVNKNKHPKIDQHGKVVINWILTVLLVATCSYLILPGIFQLFVYFLLFLFAFVNPLAGARKVQSKKVWIYPGSIPFFKIVD